MWLESGISRKIASMGLVFSILLSAASCKSGWKTLRKCDERSAVQTEQKAVGHKRITVRYWSHGLGQVPPPYRHLMGDTLAFVPPSSSPNHSPTPPTTPQYAMEILEEEVQSMRQETLANRAVAVVEKSTRHPQYKSLLLGTLCLVLTLILLVVASSRLTRYLSKKIIH